MKYEIPPLPYRKNALAPYLGAETVELHYDKHHKGYLEKLNKLVRGKPEGERSLEQLICTTSGELFNNAAQVWNHNFYWMSLRPDGGGEPTDELAKRIDEAFGSYREFRSQFAKAAIGEFGSGWAWLVKDMRGCLLVCSSDDAENPLQRNLVPLLTLDVWEHAYYLDYRNERKRYVEKFLDHLLNWDFVATNLMLAPPPTEIHEIERRDHQLSERTKRVSRRLARRRR